MLAVNLLVFSINSYNQRKNEEFTRLQVSLQNEHNVCEYYRILSEEQENQSELIHDIRHHLTSIAGLNKEGQNRKIDSYIQELMGSPGLDNTVKICRNELLNVILSRYQNLCRNKGILLYTDIRSNTTNFISDNDLTVLFGNLMENAYEDGVFSVPANDIIMIEVNQRKVMIHTASMDYLSIQSMQYWLNLLPGNCFFQSHRCNIINLEHVTDFTHEMIHLDGGVLKALLSKRKYTDFKNAYLLYLDSQT